MTLRKLSFALASVLGLAAGCSDVARPSYPDRRGGRGDTCLTLNDCKEPLVCGGGMCMDPHNAVAASGKQCVALECSDDIHCCTDLLPRAQCDQLEADCAGSPTCLDQVWAPRCECTRRCRDFHCEAKSPVECETVADCYGMLGCVDGACRHCREDSACGEGGVCAAGNCVTGCRVEADCAPLETCADNGHCETRACLDDRECKFVLATPDARCRAGACEIPCSNDGRCASLNGPAFVTSDGFTFADPEPFVCVDGACAPLGCARDSDCRSAGSVGGQDGVLACVDDERAGELRALGAL